MLYCYKIETHEEELIVEKGNLNIFLMNYKKRVNSCK